MLRIATAILFGLTAVTITPNSTYDSLDVTPINPAPIETAIATEQYTHPIGPEQIVVFHEVEHYEVTSLKSLAYSVAMEQGLSIADTIELIHTVECESSWNPRALGDGGESRGLAQINEPHWPDISPEQAYDPHFALNFIAEKFKSGNKRWWTCWRTLYL